MAIVVMATKGGVGKSSIVQNVCAALALKKFGKAEIRELDDHNKDAEWLVDSAITAVQIPVKSGRGMEPLFEAGDVIGKDSEHVVIDVGGNETAQVFADTLDSYKVFRRFVDAVIIPVSDNRISVDTAIRTYELIKSKRGIKDLADKVIIAFNRVDSFTASLSYPDSKHYSEGEFEAQMREVFFNAFENLIDENNLPWFSVEGIQGQENMYLFGKTIWEVYQDGEEFENEVEERLLDLMEGDDKAAIKKASRQASIVGKVNSHWGKAVAHSVNQLEKLIDLVNPNTKEAETKAKPATKKKA